MKAQFVTDVKGNKTAVLIPIHDYEKMILDMEELADIKLYDEVKSRNEKSIPFEEYLKKRKRRKNA